MLYPILIALELLVLYLLARTLHLGFGRLFANATHSYKITTYFLALLFLPGTFVHETSHFLMALFLLVPVGTIDLVPRIEGRGVVLGSVPVGKTDFVRRTLIGFAPVLFGLIIIVFCLWFVSSRGLFENPLVVLAVSYLCFEVGNTMFMSKRDIEGSWKFLVFLVFVSCIMFFLARMFDIALIDWLVGLLMMSSVQSMLLTVAIFLAIPIAIDIVLVLIFKGLKYV